jgi:anthranilate phosphoribosyltransferase
VREDAVDPRDLGIAAASADALRGADAVHNAAVTRRVLDGETGPIRDAVVLNAAAALVAVAGASDEPVTAQLAAVLPKAAESLDSGAAKQALDDWITTSQSAAP